MVPRLVLLPMHSSLSHRDDHTDMSVRNAVYDNHAHHYRSFQCIKSRKGDTTNFAILKIRQWPPKTNLWNTPRKRKKKKNHRRNKKATRSRPGLCRHATNTSLKAAPAQSPGSPPVAPARLPDETSSSRSLRWPGFWR